MARITMSFNLPEEREEYELAYKGIKYSIVIDEFDNWLRSILKYNESKTEAEIAIYQECRDKLHELKRDEDL